MSTDDDSSGKGSEGAVTTPSIKFDTMCDGEHADVALQLQLKNWTKEVIRIFGVGCVYTESGEETRDRTHCIDALTIILLLIYSIGRGENAYGEDFKPKLGRSQASLFGTCSANDGVMALVVDSVKKRLSKSHNVSAVRDCTLDVLKA